MSGRGPEFRSRVNKAIQKSKTRRLRNFRGDLFQSKGNIRSILLGLQRSPSTNETQHKVRMLKGYLRRIKPYRVSRKKFLTYNSARKFTPKSTNNHNNNAENDDNDNDNDNDNNNNNNNNDNNNNDTVLASENEENEEPPDGGKRRKTRKTRKRRC
jgi:hypothetical protein